MEFNKTTWAFLILILNFSTISIFSQDTLKVANVEAVLYAGKNESQPLIVGLGGSEGGNAWTTDYWKKNRQEFIDKGYAFLAVGYFGCKNTPPILDRISMNDVHNAITEASKNRKINKKKIAVIGGSRGGDLALLLGSYYPDISCVIGMSTSHAVFPGHTQEFATSCWTFDNKELPFVPVNDEAVPFLIKHDLRGAFEAMLKDTVAEEKATIKVEMINGPVLLLSGTKDEIIPAVQMGNKIINRLKSNKFKYTYEHQIYEGSHAEPTKHFDKIFAFLEKNFK
jgi:pimeloyl-ACP methyl ester carboxylesterase